MCEGRRAAGSPLGLLHAGGEQRVPAAPRAAAPWGAVPELLEAGTSPEARQSYRVSVSLVMGPVGHQLGASLSSGPRSPGTVSVIAEGFGEGLKPSASLAGWLEAGLGWGRGCL